MATITTDMIKQLRETTGAGVLDCRKALEQSDGDLKKAILPTFGRPNTGDYQIIGSRKTMLGRKGITFLSR